MQNLFCYEREEEEEEEEEEKGGKQNCLRSTETERGEISAWPELKATASIYHVKG